MSYTETIVSQVTCPGKSAVGILRISGPHSNRVAIQVLGKIPLARFATYSKFFDKNHKILDWGISLWFPAPFSFTGEDVLELQGHGSPLIMDLLVKSILSIDNVRLANPGEFSERAFLNGKINLLQAEAIDDLIHAETELSVRASLNSLQGNFFLYIKELMNILVDIRITIESNIDFSEDDIYSDFEDIINKKFQALRIKFMEIKNVVVKNTVLREEKRIVIAGLPNSGKSSLLNILSCSERAIVTSIPGTTRDIICEHININGIIYKLIDTAGLRDTTDSIEKIGITRAWQAVKSADHILFLIDNTLSKIKQEEIYNQFLKDCPKNVKITFVLNKNDLTKDDYDIRKIRSWYFVRISAQTGRGIDMLCQHIACSEKNKMRAGVFFARRRHIHQIDLALNAFEDAQKTWNLHKNVELLANSLNTMNKFLGEITGHVTSKELLNRIFSKFCIGK
ncbi:MAG: tRNA uridine-5-carboxymethylaminomethyl(34) synthesis GTPase MnmE [Buchnera aphidicola (Pentalonia nigronervosa)]|jgi:tRNA modification GTPase|uniref:tRNA modification GTPase MnmE n=1 Tax=Buchnera aphidicola (Pentalonia nigronervosa) TaxID=1309793 RepID=A0A7H1AZ69_9GAMM|nr:MAG: tRNA uridine-5-carboxymethylaminomethyl(34) synthesis GTPase MnmE [Buchnera aphidicola (Pentalonia nigronervosa)]